ncbi:TetR/AcrR family transcriptional regulator [Desemzia sp. FAM 23991]|uniref:TetR/AcrR family transcriptional regulator n=1 Tax=unclassified Desemzia TaxID=2685243 RepID=UPI003888AE90
MKDLHPLDIKQLTKTQQKIVDAALDLISHIGYKSTTTKKIADQAGVNETTIFKNFKTKQILIDTAYKQHTTQITDEVDEFFSHQFENTEDLMRKAGRFIAEMYHRHRTIVIGTVKEVGNENMKSISNYKEDYVNNSLCEKLKSFSMEHRISEQEYETIVYIFSGAILSWLIDNVRREYMEDTEESRVDLEDIIEMMVKMLK